jgi:protein associated with RNAse G/E
LPQKLDGQVDEDEKDTKVRHHGLDFSVGKDLQELLTDIEEFRKQFMHSLASINQKLASNTLVISSFFLLTISNQRITSCFVSSQFSSAKDKG